jgi:TRAP-type C4-dicarboxylate transport system substrate-binding protein
VDYVTDIPLMYFCGVMTLTGKSFNKLSAQDQTIVREVFGKAFKHIEERNRIDNVSAFDALLNQGVESVVLNDAEKNIWLGMQQPAEQMMQTEGQLSTAALERIKALVRDFRQSQ